MTSFELRSSLQTFIYFCLTYVLRAVVLSEHVALVERLPALLGVEGRLVQHHAALLTRGHFIAEGAVTAKGQHGGCHLLEL